MRVCNGNGECINSIGGYSCRCYAGFSGKNCSVNNNECEINNGTQKCQNGGSCVDGIGRFTCICTPNYLGSINLIFKIVVVQHNQGWAHVQLQHRLIKKSQIVFQYRKEINKSIQTLKKSINPCSRLTLKIFQVLLKIF